LDFNPYQNSYTLDLELKNLIDEEGLEDKTKRKSARQELKKVFEARYSAQADAKSEKSKVGTAYFFKKLRF
jgi:hypothetical protein